MNEREIGTHQGHCCVKHGCKYGDSDCPVVGGQVKQKYTCEDCDMDGITSVDELLIKVKIEVKDACKIEVMMDPDKEMAEQGTPYFWCIMKYNEDLPRSGWHEEGSGWATSAKQAFVDASEKYELLIGDK